MDASPGPSSVTTSEEVPRQVPNEIENLHWVLRDLEELVDNLALRVNSAVLHSEGDPAESDKVASIRAPIAESISDKAVRVVAVNHRLLYLLSNIQL